MFLLGKVADYPYNLRMGLGTSTKTGLAESGEIEPNGTALSEVAAAVAQLQRALQGVAKEFPSYPTKAPELQQMLGIDRSLAWKVHRLMHARSAAEAAAFVPGAAAIEILCKAAMGVGVGEGAIAALNEAFAGYDRSAATHAGDRRSARLMLKSEDPGEGGAELGLRRAAYEAGAFLAGLRARAHVQAYIVSPGTRENSADMVAIRAMYDLERLRVGAPFSMARVKTAKPGDAHFHDAPVQPLEPMEPGQMVPLIRRFCSTPLPTFAPVEREDGGIEDELTNWPVGKTGAVTVVAGVAARDHFHTVATPRGETSRMGARVRVPCQVLIVDELVDRRVWGEGSAPEVEVYCELSGDASWYTRNIRGLRVPINARVEPLGRGLGGVGTPDVPRYQELLEFAFAARGLNPNDFEGYRVRIEFPLLPTGVSLVRQKRAASQEDGAQATA
jgi:hypothetical protein